MGKALIFVHRQTHEDCIVENATDSKYVIRTDVLYRKLRTPEEDDEDEKRKAQARLQLDKQLKKQVPKSSFSIMTSLIWSLPFVAIGVPLLYRYMKK